MIRKVNLIFVGIHFFVLFISSCKHEAMNIDGTTRGYPEKIGNLLVNKCAVSGCHNDISKNAASGLSLATWEKLFEGTSNGAAVIPYNHRQSTMFLFCNTFSDLGTSLKPTMPAGKDPLTKEEIILLRDWIDQGAPDKNGYISFSDNPARAKYYVCNQGCDLVTVIDAESGKPMRCFEVGRQVGQIESPHQIRVSPDGKYYYIIFLNGSVFQKYRTSDDSFVGEVQITTGSWNTFVITSNSKYAFLVDYNSSDPGTAGQGRVFYVSLDEMKILARYQGPGLFNYPHAVMLNKTEDILYLFGQQGSYYYKVDMRTSLGNSAIAPEFSPSMIMKNTGADLLMPHDAVLSPDGDRYLVSCQNVNEVRIYSSVDDTLLYAIPVGVFPQEITISAKHKLAFVACMEDTVSFPGKKGSIAVINYQTGSLVKFIHTGWQPHGVAVDDERDLLIVANRNASKNGPAPHHTSDCGGRNGYITNVDLKTLEIVQGYKTEVSVDPYFVSVRK